MAMALGVLVPEVLALGVLAFGARAPEVVPKIGDNSSPLPVVTPLA